MYKFIVAVVLAVVLAGDASAVCPNRGVNVGNRQVVVGNQLVTLDRFGNVVRRQFIRGANQQVVVNRSLLNVNGGRSLADRLIFGF